MSDRLASLIVDVPDFPKEGIIFKDITPALADAGGFKEVIDTFAARWRDEGLTQVVAIESRGYVFGSALAYVLGVGLSIVRKPGKLPREVIAVEYELEYGTDKLEMHADALTAKDRVLVIDDLLATGGTAAAAIELVKQTGADIAGIAFAIELDFLKGRDKLPSDIELQVLMHVG